MKLEVKGLPLPGTPVSELRRGKHGIEIHAGRSPGQPDFSTVHVIALLAELPAPDQPRALKLKPGDSKDQA